MKGVGSRGGVSLVVGEVDFIIPDRAEWLMSTASASVRRIIISIQSSESATFFQSLIGAG